MRHGPSFGPFFCNDVLNRGGEQQINSPMSTGCSPISKRRVAQHGDLSSPSALRKLHQKAVPLSSRPSEETGSRKTIPPKMRVTCREVHPANQRNHKNHCSCGESSVGGPHFGFHFSSCRVVTHDTFLPAGHLWPFGVGGRAIGACWGSVRSTPRRCKSARSFPSAAPARSPSLPDRKRTATKACFSARRSSVHSRSIIVLTKALS